MNNMRFSIDLLIPGVMIVKDITCSTKKDFIIPAGTILTKEHINRCELRNVQYVYIKVHDKNETFSEVFNLIVAKAVKEGKIEKLKELSEIYKAYIENVNDIKFDFTKYINDRTQSMNPYKHVANVTNMVMTIAKQYNKKVPKKEQIPLEKLALASLMQDMGRIAYNPKVLSTLKIDFMTTVNNLRKDYPGIPGNILFKYLPDYHGLYGYLLSLNMDVDDTVRKTILFHQERYNNRDVGLGISLKLYRKDKLAALMAMLIRVCDVYDELLYEGPKKNKLAPFNSIPKVINLLVGKDYVYGEAVKLLFINIPLFRVGSIVRLSDNRLAIVSRIEPDNLFNPTCVDFDYRYIDMKKERLKVVTLVPESELRK